MSDRKPARHAELVLVGVLFLLAIAARWAGWRVKTNDMMIFFHWYYQLRAAGGWRGLDLPIGNYNAPFSYLLELVLQLPGPLILRMKLVFLIGDVVLAFFTYRITALRRPGSRIPIAATLVVLLYPTVVLNASFLGQIDALWAGPALGGVYFLVRNKPWWGAALCGVALAIKPQAMFIFPLLLLLVLIGKFRWRTLLAAPAAFLLLDVPALILGRSPRDLFTIYDLNRQGHNVIQLTYHAPSIWTFVPALQRVSNIRTVGTILAAAAVVGVIYVLVARMLEMTAERIVLAGALFAILVPFVLPGMHERYFFLADALTLVLVIYRPRLWFVAILVEMSSFLSYLPYLFGWGSQWLPPFVMAFMMLAALITVGYVLMSEAFATPPAELENDLGPPVPEPEEDLEEAETPRRLSGPRVPLQACRA
jgi:Gpi18-like mannosyltransferase